MSGSVRHSLVAQAILGPQKLVHLNPALFALDVVGFSYVDRNHAVRISREYRLTAVRQEFKRETVVEICKPAGSRTGAWKTIALPISYSPEGLYVAGLRSTCDVH